MLGNQRGNVGQKLQSLVVRLLGSEGRDRADHVVKPEVRLLDLQLAGLNLGEIQDIIDDSQQGSAGVVDFADIIALLGIERRLQREMGETDDGVHRGADLVAHICEEIRLRTGRVLRGVLGDLQLPLLPDQGLLLREQCHLGLRKLGGLNFELAGLLLSLHEQFGGAQIAGKNLHAHGHHRQQFLEQRLLVGTALTE